LARNILYFPKIQGITGMRPYEDETSAFCAKHKVADVFEDLIDKARFSSYND
jgi:adenine-specific DNA methylase